MHGLSNIKFTTKMFYVEFYADVFCVSCLVSHILLTQMAALAVSNFSPVFCSFCSLFACWVSIIIINYKLCYQQLHLKILV